MILTPNHVDELERALCDADSAFCHLKDIPPGAPQNCNGMVFPHACGNGASEVHTDGLPYAPITKTCPVCGKLLCPDCEYVEKIDPIRGLA